MADWNHPQLGDPYDQVLVTHLSGKDADAITLQKSAPSNLPDGAIAYDRATDLFKEWNFAGSVFVTKKLSIAGGGTGAGDAITARANLGLGSMATQDSTAIAITGGSMSGVSIDASALTTGQVALGRGGTGASLALGASGTVLQSNGSSVVFGTDGSGLINLNAANLSSGLVPAARLATVAFNGSAITNLNGNNIASGTVALARLPTGLGGLVQTVQGIATPLQTLTNVYATITGFGISITPTLSSNRVRVQISLSLYAQYGHNLTSCIDIQILSGTTVIATFLGALGGSASDPSNSVQNFGNVSLDCIDSPATTSAVAYTIKGRASLGSGLVGQNLTGTGTSVMTLTEIT